MFLYDCDSKFFCCSAIESYLFSSDCCKSVTLSATGEAAEKLKSLLGTYKKSFKSMRKAPVYGSGKYWKPGPYMYRYSNDTWNASMNIVSTANKVDIAHIISVDAALCPADVSQWRYREDGERIFPINYRLTSQSSQYGDITVKCSDK